jgi:hypothetical protein
MVKVVKPPRIYPLHFLINELLDKNELISKLAYNPTEGDKPFFVRHHLDDYDFYCNVIDHSFSNDLIGTFVLTDYNGVVLCIGGNWNSSNNAESQTLNEFFKMKGPNGFVDNIKTTLDKHGLNEFCIFPIVSKIDYYPREIEAILFRTYIEHMGKLPVLNSLFSS